MKIKHTFHQFTNDRRSEGHDAHPCAPPSRWRTCMGEDTMFATDTLPLEVRARARKQTAIHCAAGPLSVRLVSLSKEAQSHSNDGAKISIITAISCVPTHPQLLPLAKFAERVLFEADRMYILLRHPIPGTVHAIACLQPCRQVRYIGALSAVYPLQRPYATLSQCYVHNQRLEQDAFKLCISPQVAPSVF